jgi:hypothetical protein
MDPGSYMGKVFLEPQTEGLPHLKQKLEGKSKMTFSKNPTNEPYE